MTASSCGAPGAGATSTTEPSSGLPSRRAPTGSGSSWSAGRSSCCLANEVARRRPSGRSSKPWPPSLPAGTTPRCRTSTAEAASCARGSPSSRALGSGAHATHRVAPIAVDRLWRIVESPATQPTIRAAAAVALGLRLDPRDRDRLRAAASATTAPRLRAALEAAAGFRRRHRGRGAPRGGGGGGCAGGAARGRGPGGRRVKRRLDRSRVCPRHPPRRDRGGAAWGRGRRANEGRLGSVARRLRREQDVAGKACDPAGDLRRRRGVPFPVVLAAEGIHDGPGEAVIDETYRLALSESSKLKLRAVAVRAEGGEDAPYRAAVLFHAAARAERRALGVLEAPSPETRLRSAIDHARGSIRCSAAP